MLVSRSDSKHVMTIMLTFRVVLHCALEVLHDTLLSDHFLNLVLVLNVKGIFIEPRYLTLAFNPFSLLAVETTTHGLRKGDRVVYYSRQVRILPLKLLSHAGASQYLEADRLGIAHLGRLLPRRGLAKLLLRCLSRRRRRVGGGGADGPSHMDGQHLAVGNAELLHCLGVIRDEAAVVVDVLGAGLDVGLGLDELAEGRGGHIRKHLKSDELVLVTLQGVENVESNAPAT